MERVGEEMAGNDMGGNAELKIKECDYHLKPEGHNLLESPMLCVSIRSDWEESSSHNYTDMIEGKDLSRCVTSLAGSEPPCTSRCSMNDAEIVAEELTVENYSNQNLALVSNPNSSRQGQWQHLYHLASGSRSKTSHNGDAVSQDKDQIWLKVREQFMKAPTDKRSLNSLLSKKIDQVPEEISPYLRAGDNKIISANTLSNGGARLKTLSTSSFSRLFVRKSLEGKGGICEIPEVCCELGSAIVDQSDEKQGYVSKVASDALLKSSANNDLPSSHRVDRFGPESVHDGGISLREWLKPGSRKNDKLESLHLFRQIVELVDFAHSQGVALQELRPSCFKLLPSKRVIYTGSSANREIESAMNWDSSKKRPLEQDVSAYYGIGEKQQKVSEDMKSLRRQPQFTSGCGSRTKTGTESNTYVNGPQDFCYTELPSQNHFIYQSTTSVTTRQQSISLTAQLEDNWYTCPEELNERRCTILSNIYGLGVLLFELLCCCAWEVHSAVMLDLRHRILPPNFLSENPKEAGFCLWLLHPEPSSRPSTREILQSELICGSQELNSGDNSSILADNDEGDSELLLHFLMSLKEQKQKHASKLVEDIEYLEADIKEVDRRHLVRSSSVFSPAHKEFPDVRKQGLHIEDPISSVLSRSFSVSDMNETNLVRNISQLEDAYFSMRSQIKLTENAGAVRSDKDLLKNRDRWGEVQNDEEPSLNKKSSDHLGAFFEGLCKFARYSKFEVCGTLRIGDLLNSANVICSLSFDRDEDYIAAAGVSKRIKIFEFGALLNDSIDIHYPVVEMSNRSKLSCVCWNSYIKNYLASTDYDGVVKMWDASTGQGFSQYIEHQKRAWSVDFSQSDPTKFASGSDDCSVKLWSFNEKSSVGTIWNPANVCCIQFSAFSTNLLAFGSADYKVYCYDLRHTRIPWCTLVGHEKAVSYVKFLDSETLVSASTDNTLKLWDLNKTSSTGLSPGACSLTFSGHTNEKNFVGLSVLDGYIACGSETNEVYSYHRSLPMPIASHKFGSMDPLSGHETGVDNGQFVSSVCWRQKSNMIVAANSSGCMKLLRMV